MTWIVAKGPLGLAICECDEAGEVQHVVAFLWEGDWKAGWLMAAAPEMLAALENILGTRGDCTTKPDASYSLDVSGADLLRARDSIRKAKLPPSTIATTTVDRFAHHAKL